MKSINNLLMWINENWASLVTIIILLLAIFTKARKFYLDWQNKTEQEKKEEIEKAIKNAKIAIAENILSYVSDAEVNWSAWIKMGDIKRSEVIKQLYVDYPILLQVVDQDELIHFIDNAIDKALETVREKIRNDNQTM